MPKNVKTLVSNMLMEMVDNFEIHQNTRLKNYSDNDNTPPKSSWIVKYGEGIIIFQYIPSNKINVVFIESNNPDDPYMTFCFEEDELVKMEAHLLQIRQFMEDGVYSGCNHTNVMNSMVQYSMRVAISKAQSILPIP